MQKKRNSYSLGVKEEIYKKLITETPSFVIEKDYGISRTTISEIKNISDPKTEEFLKTNPEVRDTRR